MEPVFRRALGSDFDRLHPKIQEWFGFSSKDGLVAIGQGTLAYVRNGGPHAIPFLRLGALRHIMCPEQGMDVPFTVANYAYKDARGIETSSIIRTFSLQKLRRFDEHIVWAGTSGRVVNHLGTRRHLSVDLALHVDPCGDIRIRSGTQRIREGRVRFRFPRLFSADAEVSIGYDDTRSEYRIAARMANPIIGTVFEYAGRFQVAFRRVTQDEIHAIAAVA